MQGEGTERIERRAEALVEVCRLLEVTMAMPDGRSKRRMMRRLDARVDRMKRNPLGRTGGPG